MRKAGSARLAEPAGAGGKEDGELDANASGAPGAKKMRKNRGGKGRSPGAAKKGTSPNKKHKPAAAADNGTAAAPPSAASPGVPSAAAAPAAAAAPGRSLLSFLSPLMVSTVADPLLIAKPAAAAPPTPSAESASAAMPAPEPTHKDAAAKPTSGGGRQRDFVPRLPCKFFMKGRCEKGAECTFSHTVEVPKKLEVCKFFKSGVCRKGSECAFSHSFKDEICLYLLKGECTAGSKCKYSHDLQALAQGKVAGPPAPLPGAKPAASATTESKPAAPAALNSATSATNTRPLVIALSESSSADDA